ncbi:hypothetical protein JX265_007061 [Neoarthrinium moseri]|uniref:Uncharacterized protein n=1 Tax=Neoarthrinium moseri TaxID=1658444 RepID=A0A9P9WKC9_9PEZI|nr:uncharacterized protein JN550_008011 [Neoarthrinium moseri]KAI1866033.1 hypothetical protein JN550_008011 [Neoarthrinium moseri]KAI1868238.1 hypothetical protein JX265_007061 [Neoarthrinium moseri]
MAATQPTQRGQPVDAKAAEAVMEQLLERDDVLTRVQELTPEKMKAAIQDWFDGKAEGGHISIKSGIKARIEVQGKDEAVIIFSSPLNTEYQEPHDTEWHDSYCARDFLVFECRPLGENKVVERHFSTKPFQDWVNAIAEKNEFNSWQQNQNLEFRFIIRDRNKDGDGPKMYSSGSDDNGSEGNGSGSSGSG